MSELKRALYKETTIGSQQKVNISEASLKLYIAGELEKILAQIGIDSIGELKELLNAHITNKEEHTSLVDRFKWDSKETVLGAQVKVDAHGDRKDNPHGVTKEQVGLNFVENEQQATKVEFDSHVLNEEAHVTLGKQLKWDSKETPEGAQSKVDTGLVEAMLYADEVTTWGPFKFEYNELTDSLDLVVTPVVGP